MPTQSSRCPVPLEQQPLNEYESMRDSWFYRWGSASLVAYVKPIVVLWSLSWGITAPMAAASFTPDRYPVPFLLSSAMGALVLPLLVLVQLYVGWFHVGGRLKQQAVPYEESGWYDGQVWVKPEAIRNRDQLIVEYQVVPILRRIRHTFGIMAALLASGLLVWQFV